MKDKNNSLMLVVKIPVLAELMQGRITRERNTTNAESYCLSRMLLI